MLLVGMEEGLWPFQELRNLAALAQELALKNGRDVLGGLACMWRALCCYWKGQALICCLLLALPVRDRGLGHHLCCSHPRL